MAVCGCDPAGLVNGQLDRTDRRGAAIEQRSKVLDQSCKGSETMIDARYEELKRVLELRREELQRNLVLKLADVANSGRDGKRPESLDEAEASASDLQQEVGITLTEMTAAVLRRVDEALVRLASGVYGVCVECDAEIPMKRLTALPFTVRCRECEEWREAGARQTRRFSTERSHAFPRLDRD
jgi:DnaK suppressor protein